MTPEEKDRRITRIENILKKRIKAAFPLDSKISVRYDLRIKGVL